MRLEHLIAAFLCQFAKLLTGVRPLWRDNSPSPWPRVYFANHRSHGDFVLIWACLPPDLRRKTRPVAGADYWLRGKFRRYLIERVFHGVLIDRLAGRQANPVETMSVPLRAGESLILFPEGTRNLGDDLLPFKSGIAHLAQEHPAVEFVPVWIENLGRAMPKGSLIPIPLLCTLSFGPSLLAEPGESRSDFLLRCRNALLALSPAND
jgi:1-acyl-sn-glycerol-3-phosphate acyltransferase